MEANHPKFILILVEPDDWFPVYRCLMAADKDAAEVFASNLANENGWQLIDVLEPNELRNIAKMETDYTA